MWTPSCDSSVTEPPPLQPSSVGGPHRRQRHKHHHHQQQQRHTTATMITTMTTAATDSRGHSGCGLSVGEWLPAVAVGCQWENGCRQWLWEPCSQGGEMSCQRSPGPGCTHGDVPDRPLLCQGCTCWVPPTGGVLGAPNWRNVGCQLTATMALKN